jgi:hypothetical protein
VSLEEAVATTEEVPVESRPKRERPDDAGDAGAASPPVEEAVSSESKRARTETAEESAFVAAVIRSYSEKDLFLDLTELSKLDWSAANAPSAFSSVLPIRVSQFLDFVRIPVSFAAKFGHIVDNSQCATMFESVWSICLTMDDPTIEPHAVIGQILRYMPKTKRVALEKCPEKIVSSFQGSDPCDFGFAEYLVEATMSGSICDFALSSIGRTMVSWNVDAVEPSYLLTLRKRNHVENSTCIMGFRAGDCVTYTGIRLEFLVVALKSSGCDPLMLASFVEEVNLDRAENYKGTDPSEIPSFLDARNVSDSHVPVLDAYWDSIFDDPTRPIKKVYILTGDEHDFQTHHKNTELVRWIQRKFPEAILAAAPETLK